MLVSINHKASLRLLELQVFGYNLNWNSDLVMALDERSGDHSFSPLHEYVYLLRNMKSSRLVTINTRDMNQHSYQVKPCLRLTCISEAWKLEKLTDKFTYQSKLRMLRASNLLETCISSKVSSVWGFFAKMHVIVGEFKFTEWPLLQSTFSISLNLLSVSTLDHLIRQKCHLNVT